MLAHADLIDLTRATPPVTPVLNSALKSTLAAIAGRGDLDRLVRSNRIGGGEGDRAACLPWLRARLGLPLAPDRIVIGNGTQSLLSLTLRHVVGRGGTLLAEVLTHPLVPPIAAECGVSVIPVAIDEHGVIPEAVERACSAHAPAALYCNPTGHNPTASVMPAERRKAVVAIARRYGIAIIEDDVLGALRRSGPPPVAHFGPDCVWYLQTLSKCVGLGFRVAYLVTPEQVHRDAIVSPMNMRSSWFPGALPVEIANYLMRNRLMAEINASFADAALGRQRIAEAVLSGVDYVTCQGALHLWLRLPGGWRSDAFAASCRKAGVLVRTSTIFAARPAAGGPDIPAVRVALAAPDTDQELQEGLRRLMSVLGVRSEVA